MQQRRTPPLGGDADRPRGKNGDSAEVIDDTKFSDALYVSLRLRSSLCAFGYHDIRPAGPDNM
jgi:hypothetical protein